MSRNGEAAAVAPSRRAASRRKTKHRRMARRAHGIHGESWRQKVLEAEAPTIF